MKRSQPATVSLCPLLWLLLTAAVPFPADSPLDSAAELFPATPGPNVQRGFAVATDGSWLAVGSSLDDEKGKDAGAVQLFRWNNVLATWKPDRRLKAEPAQAGARFGFALALRGQTLAVSALGEGEVYLFRWTEEEGWAQQQRLTPSRGPAPGRFGRSLSLDGNLLAVGSVATDETEAGSVSLFSLGDGHETEVVPQVPQAGERFGEAVALKNGVLAAGAPEHGSSSQRATGAVYVFRGPGWQQEGLLADSAAAPGARLGSSVAILESWILAGAPADGGGTNKGAVYAFPADANGAWTLPGQQLAAGVRDGERLGASLAARGKILVIGAPFGGKAFPASESETEPGRAVVFQSAPDQWNLVAQIQPDNAEPLDLAGGAVAVSPIRVVIGAPLGDQGSGAAGAVWTFRCKPKPAGCVQEAEAVARQTAPADRFGKALAVDRATGRLAVTSGRDGEGTLVDGKVSVFRRAGGGWRQEALIASPSPDPNAGFGTALAIDGDLLAVGAPHESTGVSPAIPDIGAVYLYRWRGVSWELEARLQSPFPGTFFGSALSLSENWLVVGAPGAGSVFVYERGLDERWNKVPRVVKFDQSAKEKFGFSVSVLADTLAVGAPGGGSARGTVYTVDLKTSGLAPVAVAGQMEAGNKLGWAVAVGKDWLAAGAPGGASFTAGVVYVFARAGSGWVNPQLLQGKAGAGHDFGAAVSFNDSWLVVGSPGPGPFQQSDEDRAYLFARDQETWVCKASVDALQVLHGNRFGTGVGVGPGFFAVTDPDGKEGGDRVTLFPLRESLPCGNF